MKTIISNLRNDIRTLAADQVAFGATIRNLAWTPGSEQAVANLRAAVSQSHWKVAGKKTLKRFRRPETGSERNLLHMVKLTRSVDIRYKLLALAMLRNVAYTQVEKSTSRPPDWSILLRTLHMEFDRANIAPLYSKEDVQDWLSEKALGTGVEHDNEG